MDRIERFSLVAALCIGSLCSGAYYLPGVTPASFDQGETVFDAILLISYYYSPLILNVVCFVLFINDNNLFH